MFFDILLEKLRDSSHDLFKRHFTQLSLLQLKQSTYFSEECLIPKQTTIKWDSLFVEFIS